MAKKQEENEEVIVDVQEVYSKTETFVDENKNILVGVVIAVIAIVGGFLAYNSLYLEPMQKEANQSMFMAEKYFEKDSLETAVYGNDEFAGFMEIADEYGSTKAGNLANYYLGISFLKLGEYENALKALKKFDSDDEMLGTIALGAQGDAYAELEDLEQAAEYYEKAAKRKPNQFTSPLYLKKAGMTYELLGDYNEAVNVYNTIKTEWKKSAEASEIDKYIARAESSI